MDHRLVALLRRQGVQQREGLILLRRQRLEQARTGRLGTPAARSHGEKALLDDGIAQREVMAQEAPSPRVLEARPPEESDEVLVAVAGVARHNPQALVLPAPE